jgi:hypothetical protein
MSLDFNYKNVADQSLITNPHDDEEYHPVLNAMVWLSMYCGYSKITKDNAEQICLRIRVWQHMHGAFIHKRRETNSVSAVYITLRDVEAYIGLTTNADVLTDAAFAKRVLAWVQEIKLPRNEGVLGEDFSERTAIDIIAQK